MLYLSSFGGIALERVHLFSAPSAEDFTNVFFMDLAPGFEILNLGGAETTALKDLVSWLAEELGVEPRIDYLPDQPGDVPITYADVSKAGQLLGYSPKVPIREGLREFVRWYRTANAAARSAR